MKKIYNQLDYGIVEEYLLYEDGEIIYNIKMGSRSCRSKYLDFGFL